MPVEEINFQAVRGSLWRRKLMIAWPVAVSLVLAIIYLNVATYRYAVTLVVTPVQSVGGSPFSKLGGLADMAGLSLPGDASADAFKIYMEGLKSRPVADELAKDQRVMIALFPDEWAKNGAQWREPSSVRRSLVQIVKRLMGVPVYPWKRPDGARLQEILERDINIVETRDQPAVSVILASSDPDFGRYLLSRLHSITDDLIKARARERAITSVSYLQGRLLFEKVPDYRQILVQYLAQQEQVRMLASGSVPYSAEPFGAPAASERPVSPRPMLVLLLALAIGLAIGIPLALITDRPRTSAEPDE